MADSEKETKSNLRVQTRFYAFTGFLFGAWFGFHSTPDSQKSDSLTVQLFGARIPISSTVLWLNKLWSNHTTMIDVVPLMQMNPFCLVGQAHKNYRSACFRIISLNTELCWSGFRVSKAQSVFEKITGLCCTNWSVFQGVLKILCMKFVSSDLRFVRWMQNGPLGPLKCIWFDRKTKKDRGSRDRF